MCDVTPRYTALYCVDLTETVTIWRGRGTQWPDSRANGLGFPESYLYCLMGNHVPREGLCADALSSGVTDCMD